MDSDMQLNIGDKMIKKPVIEADAIIFDKDGTLLDFDAFWVPVTELAVNRVLDKLNMTKAPVEEILVAFGIRDGVTSVDGILCRGTYTEMAEIMYEILKGYGYRDTRESLEASLIEEYGKSTANGLIKPTCPDLAATLAYLKGQNKRLAVVTTDNPDITLTCLKSLGIDGFFDRIYTDDGKMPTKPDPYCLIDFCTAFGVSPERTVVVGDTITDVKFASNAGALSIALVSKENGEKNFADRSTAIISKISQLTEIIK